MVYQDEDGNIYHGDMMDGDEYGMEGDDQDYGVEGSGSPGVSN